MSSRKRNRRLARPTLEDSGFSLDMATGLLPSGARASFTPPPWRRCYGFWHVWEACRMLALTGLQHADAHEQQGLDPFPWRTEFEPGSQREMRQQFGWQMRLAMTSVHGLSEAQIITISTDTLGLLETMRSQQAATETARTAHLPAPFVYLDFMPTGFGGDVAAMRLGADDQLWGLGGALLTRPVAEALQVTLFGAPPGHETGPLSQPLGRLLIADRDVLGDASEGTVRVDADSFASFSDALPHESDMYRRAAATANFTGPALEFVDLLNRAKLIPELRNPKARKQLERGGERIALTPAPTD